jgi:hypothetical protein
MVTSPSEKPDQVQLTYGVFAPTGYRTLEHSCGHDDARKSEGETAACHSWQHDHARAGREAVQ